MAKVLEAEEVFKQQSGGTNWVALVGKIEKLLSNPVMSRIVTGMFQRYMGGGGQQDTNQNPAPVRRSTPAQSKSNDGTSTQNAGPEPSPEQVYTMMTNFIGQASKNFGDITLDELNTLLKQHKGKALDMIKDALNKGGVPNEIESKTA